MKKYLLIALASLFAFTSCSKESNEAPEVNTDKTVTLTFTSKRPQLKSDTKTAWDEGTSSIIWSENDKIRVGYTLNGNWMGQSSAGTAKFYASDAVSIDTDNQSLGTFKVPISGSSFEDPETNGSYQFYAIYPSSILSDASVNDPTVKSITVPETQDILSGTFDHKADLLVGKSSAMVLSGLPTDPISLSWTRLVAHADLTFSNLAISGTEIVSKITLTFNEDAKVVGSVDVNIPAGTAGTGSSNVLVLSSGTGISSSSSSFEAWACVLPVTFTSLNVEIKTDKATYTRNINGINKTFKGNARNTLTVNMATATRTAVAQYEWVKKDLSEITSSDVFVIVGNNGGNYAMSNGNGTGSAPSAVAVTVANNKLSAAPAESIQWTLSVSGSNYTFYPVGNTATWLYCNTTANSSSNNNMRVGTGDRKVFVIDADGYLLTNDTYTNRYLSVYNGSDWRGYTTKSTTLEFYVKSAPDTRAEAGLSYAQSEYTANLGESFTAPTLTNPNSLTVSYSSSNESVATVNANTGAVTLVAAGSTVITASFAGGATYQPGTASYTLTVTDPNVNDGSATKPYTASEAAAAAIGGSTDEVYVKGIISSIATAYNSTHNNVSFYISENGSTNTFEIYRASATSEDDFKVGDYVVFKGNLTTYTSGSTTTPELASGNTLITQVIAPVFTPDGGNFTGDSQSVTITADDGATIYYTTDGTTPTTSSSVYSSLSIAATTTIKAFAVKDGNATGVVEKTFTKVSISAVDVTFTGTDSGGMTTTAGEQSGTKDNVTIAITNGVVSGSQIRIYKNATVTISAPSGKNIKNIVFNCTASGTSNYGPGGFSGSGYSYSGTTGTWTGSSNSVTLTASNSQVRATEIVVTYE